MSLTKAFADSQRSYLTAKAATSAVADELYARAPNMMQTSDFSLAKNQYQHFRGIVFACIRAIAQRIAAQPIHVGQVYGGQQRGQKSGPPANVIEFERHPLIYSLANPNSLMTGWSLMYTTVASLELTGRQLWWTTETDGICSIYPIPSSWIIKVEGTNTFERFLIRPPNHAGDPIVIDSSEAAYMHYPNPSNPREVMSPLQAAARAVDSDDHITTSQGAAFAQGLNPGHLIIIGKVDGQRPRLTGRQRSQLIESIRTLYAGTHHSGDPMIVDAMIEDVKPLRRSIKEMDFLRSGKLTEQRILKIFGTNPIVIGEIEGANRASSLAAETHFAEYTLNPKIELLSGALTEWLSPKFAVRGSRLAVWIEPVVPRDSEMRLAWADMLAKYGVIGVDELRRLSPLDLPEELPAVPVQPPQNQRTMAYLSQSRPLSDYARLAVPSANGKASHFAHR